MCLAMYAVKRINNFLSHICEICNRCLVLTIVQQIYMQSLQLLAKIIFYYKETTESAIYAQGIYCVQDIIRNYNMFMQLNFGTKF